MRIPLTITNRGVITLPARLRRELGLKADDQLIAETTADGLLLRPAVVLPVEIYSDARVREFDAAEAALSEVLEPVATAEQRKGVRSRRSSLDRDR